MNVEYKVVIVGYVYVTDEKKHGSSHGILSFVCGDSTFHTSSKELSCTLLQVYSQDVMQKVDESKRKNVSNVL